MPSRVSVRRRDRIAQRRAQVAVLFHAHYSQNEIAKQLGVDRSQISRDLAALRTELQTPAADTEFSPGFAGQGECPAEAKRNEASDALSRYNVRRREEIAQRRARAAALYHARLTQNEIAEQLGVNRAQISRDLAAIRAEWKTQAATAMADIQADELAFYFAQRASALAEWEETHDPRHMLLVIKWSERIALVYGLDAAVTQSIAITALRAEELTDDELAAIVARDQPSASGADSSPAA